jgi:hypothetical protein
MSTGSAASHLPDIERRRLRALATRDVAAAAPLHADDYQLITPNGSAMTRDDYLGDVASGRLPYRVFEPVSDIVVPGDAPGRDPALPGPHQLRRRTRLHVLAHRLLPAAGRAAAGGLVPGHPDHRPGAAAVIAQTVWFRAHA